MENWYQRLLGDLGIEVEQVDGFTGYWYGKWDSGHYFVHDNPDHLLMFVQWREKRGREDIKVVCSAGNRTIRL